LVLPFWYRLTLVVLEKGPLNGCVLCKEVFTCILREFYAGFVSTADHKSDDETEKFIPLSAASGRKRNPYWYGYRIAKFGQAGKVGKVCLVMFSCLFSALGM